MINKFKMAKHFIIEITDCSVTFRRNGDKIGSEAALGGLCVLRTTVDQEVLTTTEVTSC